MENGTCHFINETKFPVKGVTVVSNIEVLKWQMNYTYMILNSAGNKVYEKKVLEEHTLYFPEAHRYAEDIPFSIGLFSVAEKVAIVPQSLYYYVRTKGSISRSYTLKHAEDVYLDWKEALQAIRRNGVKINTDNFSLGMYFASMKQLTWSADKQEKTSAQAKKLRARWEKARKKQRWKPDFASAQVPFLHKLKIVLAYCHLQGLMFAGARLLRWIPFFKFMV